MSDATWFSWLESDSFLISSGHTWARLFCGGGACRGGAWGAVCWGGG